MSNSMFYSISNKSLSDMGVATYKELWESVSKDNRGLSVEVPVEIKKEDETYKVVFSTENEDRHGDVVKQNFDLKSFKKNPVLLDSHNYGSIEHIIGKVSKITQKPSLNGNIEFATMNPKGALAQAMADAGYINATSIGFIPKEFDDKGNITKSELLEISVVSVPANAQALFEKTVAEVEEIKSTVTEETPDEQVVETTVKIDQKKFILNNIAKGIREMQAQNLAEKKRHVLKAIRQL